MADRLTDHRELDPPFRCPVCFAAYWSEKAICRGGHPNRLGMDEEHRPSRVVLTSRVTGAMGVHRDAEAAREALAARQRRAANLRNRPPRG